MVNNFDGESNERDFFAKEVKAYITATGFFLCKIFKMSYFGQNVLVEDLAFYFAENTRIDLYFENFAESLEFILLHRMCTTTD